jgi:hypothetical protein
MTETIGSRVGVFRRKIPLLRAAILFALIFALVTAVAVVLTHRPDTDTFGYFFAYVTSWCLVMVCLWLTPLIWKVTLFEGGIRGPTRGFGFRTLAWDDISSAERMPLGLRSLGIGFDAVQKRRAPVRLVFCTSFDRRISGRDDSRRNGAARPCVERSATHVSP